MEKDLQKANNTLMTSLLPTQLDGVMTLRRKQFNAFRATVPKRVEDTLDSIPICVLERAIEPSIIQQYLEGEVLRASVQMNVANNLRPDQVTFCAQALIETFPVQSLEDFTLCLKRLAIGFYGTTYHQFDSAVIIGSMKQYVEEKAVYLERRHQSIITEPVEGVDYAAFKERRNAMQIKEVQDREQEFYRRKMEANKEIDFLKARASYKPDPEKGKEILLKQQWIRENFDPITGQQLKGFVDLEQWKKSKGSVRLTDPS